MRTVEDIARNLLCVGITKRIYTAIEVGDEKAGCMSFYCYFEHDPKKTTRGDIISIVIEIMGEHIGDYDFEMWDGRTLEQHIGELHV